MSEEQNQTVVETIKGNIKILRFNQPNRKNAANMNAYIKIRQALKEAAENCDISMVILTGTGDFYCSGNDLKERRDKGPELTNELLDRIKEMVEEFVLFPKPLVAIVNGPAVGVAVTTLALCDFVFAAEHAYFYAPFTKLGVVPEACSTYTFPKLIGYRKALELLLLNQRISSKEALSCGLVNNVWGMEELEERAWEKIEEINNIPTDTFVKAKKLFRQPILKQLLVANNAEMDTLRTFVGLKSRLSSSLSSITDLFRPSNPTGLRSRDLSSTRLSALKKEIQTDAHLIPLKDLYTNLETDPVNGLRKEQANRRLAYDGPNTLTPATQYGWPLLLFKSLCTGFSTLIWLGAILCLAAYVIERATKLDPGTDNLYLGCVLITVDVICGLFSFFQNYQSRKIMKSFKSMIPMHARCTRDGVLDTEMPVRDLVKGDIVEVRAGDVIPADIRIIDSKGFKVDNSSLTGESVAVSRSNVEGTENILDSPNVAFFSALCVEGYAKGVILCCGDLTALGRVAGLAARLQPKPSPLAQELHRFMRYVSVWALILGFVVATACFALGYPFMQTIIFVIGMIVANIPEGLQPTVTASLTLTAKRMVSKNCLVKNLESIEALGACTTICSDKTGTLTENKMCVRHIWMWNREFMMGTDADDSMYHHKAFEHLKICAALCSSATVENETIRGDASEKAILNFLLQFNDPIGIRGNFPKVAEIPFNSVNKYQMSIHSDSQSKYLLVIKGAPECILAKCSTIIAENEELAITKEIAAVIDKVTENLASTGERILAFADLQLDATQFNLNLDFDMDEANFPLKDLRFLGLMGLIDPPRKEVRSAIEHVRSAGVRVMMVTGDHPATARAIAADVSIATQGDCRVVTGAELRRMTPDLLTKTLEKHYEIVFARTSPTQKLQIVEACQKLGGVVAVTGDGVNDAPALKCADIGISMGITGSQVSQHTADIILIDDNFATIVVGIEEGRKIFDNLKKSICYILISNVPEIFPVLMFVLFSIPLPLGVMTILCVDLGTDMWPAVALSFEQAESDVMSRPPRAGPLVSPRMLALTYGHLGLMEFAAGMFAYFIVMAEFGFYPRDLFGIRKQWDCEAVNDLPDSLGQEWTYWERKEVERAGQAAYFAAVVVTQMTNGVICKTRYNSIFHVGMRNMVLNMGLVFELLLACFVCYTPGLNTFLRTYPLPLKWWFLALPYSALMFAFDELRKYCIRKRLFRGWYNNITLY